jgi:hypothetical protein
MDWLKVPTEEASIIFPIGAVIEDEKGIYKILEFQKQECIHKYKVEVITLKTPIPPQLKHYGLEKTQWLIVMPQNLKAITRIE